VGRHGRDPKPPSITRDNNQRESISGKKKKLREKKGKGLGVVLKRRTQEGGKSETVQEGTGGRQSKRDGCLGKREKGRYKQQIFPPKDEKKKRNHRGNMESRWRYSRIQGATDCKERVKEIASRGGKRKERGGMGGGRVFTFEPGPKRTKGRKENGELFPLIPLVKDGPLWFQGKINRERLIAKRNGEGLRRKGWGKE